MNTTTTTNVMPAEALTQLSKLIKQQEKIKAVLVVKSKATGKDNTYQISSAPANDKYPYSIFIGYETSYNKFNGCARSYKGKASLFKKFTETNSSVIKGAKFVLDKILAGDIKKLLSVAEISHTGHCIKCNKELTDLESIEFGMGSTCRGK